VLESVRARWPALKWVQEQAAQAHEAHLLYLDSSKAKSRLGWRPVWSLDEALDATVRWYRRYHEEGVVESRAQLGEYVAAAGARGAVWTQP
jgi:CDP-glucose 4,6-dehydratase